MAGYPIGYFYGYKVEGVLYQTEEEIKPVTEEHTGNRHPGDLKFRRER